MQFWLCNRISAVASLVIFWWLLSGDVKRQNPSINSFVYNLSLKSRKNPGKKPLEAEQAFHSIPNCLNPEFSVYFGQRDPTLRIKPHVSPDRVFIYLAEIFSWLFLSFLRFAETAWFWTNSPGLKSDLNGALHFTISLRLIKMPQAVLSLPAWGSCLH